MSGAAVVVSPITFPASYTMGILEPGHNGAEAMGNIRFAFDERVVVVTGAASGIGKATAHAFGAAGAHVYVLDVDSDAGSEVGAEIDGARFLHCDVTSPESVSDAMATIDSDHGVLDILVNNAGGFWVQRSTAELPREEWQRVMDLNLNAVFLMAQQAVPLIQRSNQGRIVNVGSLAGQVASYKTSPAYASAKAGVHSLTRVLATELADSGITVNAVAPSAVMTERILQLRDEAERRATAQSIPLGRYQETEEVASWILFLASDEAGFATGQTLAVNGGRHMV
ncbi:MAG: SDR family oxidoreductase [Acidimicrobiia bacterium]|nr:SDR family oxidoreductase [Acidimicrobiia bacterium]